MKTWRRHVQCIDHTQTAKSAPNPAQRAHQSQTPPPTQPSAPSTAKSRTQPSPARPAHPNPTPNPAQRAQHGHIPRPTRPNPRPTQHSAPTSVSSLCFPKIEPHRQTCLGKKSISKHEKTPTPQLQHAAWARKLLLFMIGRSLLLSSVFWLVFLLMVLLLSMLNDAYWRRNVDRLQNTVTLVSATITQKRRSQNPRPTQPSTPSTAKPYAQHAQPSTPSTSKPHAQRAQPSTPSTAKPHAQRAQHAQPSPPRPAQPSTASPARPAHPTPNPAQRAQHSHIPRHPRPTQPSAPTSVSSIFFSKIEPHR